jgi:hypothetical protein
LHYTPAEIDDMYLSDLWAVMSDPKRLRKRREWRLKPDDVREAALQLKARGVNVYTGE